jgi:hypothetical protein
MVAAANMKLLPYFNDNLPVRHRVQRPGSSLQPAPKKAFARARPLHQYQLDPTGRVYNCSQDNSTLHTYNAKRQVQLRSGYPAGQRVDTYA